LVKINLKSGRVAKWFCEEHARRIKKQMRGEE
jgi:hypothetical protein